MAYDETHPVSGAFINANKLRENFDQGPVDIKHQLNVLGDIVIDPSGSGYSRLKFQDTGEISYHDGYNRFEFGSALYNPNGYVLGSSVLSQGDIYLNENYVGGEANPTLFFNSETQYLKWRHLEGRFLFSENIKVAGTTMSVGDDENETYFMLFNHGLGDAGFLCNDSGIVHFKNATGDWTVFGDASGNQDLNSVLGLGEEARTRDLYVRDCFSQPTAGDNYVKLGADAYPNPPTIVMAQYNVTGSFFFDGEYEQSFYMTKSLRILGAGAYLGLYAKDLYLANDAGGGTHDTSIWFGPVARNDYLHVVSEAASSIMYMRLDEVEVSGSIVAKTHIGSKTYLHTNIDHVGGIDEDSSLLFGQGKVSGSSSPEIFKYDYGNDRFETSNDLYVNGVLRIASNNIYMKQAGPDGDQFIYFYDGGSTINEWFKWDDADDRFEFSNDIYSSQSLTIGKTITAGTNITGAGLISGSYFQAANSGSQFPDLNITGNLVVGGNISGNITDVTFGDITVDTITANNSGSILPDLYVGGILTVGDDIRAQGNIYINVDAASVDSYLYFGDDADSQKASLQWDVADDRFYINSVNGLWVLNGEIKAATSLQCKNLLYFLNDYSEGDSNIYFYEGGSPTGAYIKWNDSGTSFDLSHKINVPSSGSSLGSLDIGGTLVVGGSLVGNGDIAASGDLRTNNDLRLGVTGTVTTRIYFNTIGKYLQSNASGFIFNDGVDVQDSFRCDSFRIDQTPSVGTPTPDKYITISCNGVNYQVPVKAS